MTVGLKRILYAALGLLAGIIVWGIQELALQGLHWGYLAMNLLHGALTGAIFGFCFGILDGLAMGEKSKALASGGIGAAMGLAGGALAFVLAAWGLNIMADTYQLPREQTLATLLPFSRMIGWIFIGTVIGMAEGIRSRSLRRCLSGALGGLVGGLLGGAALEGGIVLLALPLLGRLFGFALLGLALGFFIGTFEAIAAFGRLKVLTGPHKNREYLLFRSKTRLGSHWNMDVYLAKVPGVESFHALIVQQKRSFLLEGRITAPAPLLNDSPIQGPVELKYEDLIDIGAARLLFLPL